MKPLLTPSQAGELDRAAQAAGTPADILMERAGAGVARACLDLLGGGYGRRAVVVCGKGNNGGDGLVAARHLARAGVGVMVFLLEDPDTLRLDRVIINDKVSESGKPVAWTQKQRYVSLADLTRSGVTVTSQLGAQ